MTFLNLALASNEPVGIKHSVTTSEASALVLFGILEHFLRRSSTDEVAIGALMGITADQQETVSHVRIVNTIPLSLSRTQEAIEDSLLIDAEFYTEMVGLHHQSHPDEVVVGFYCTGTAPDERLVGLYDFFASQILDATPLLLMVDPLAFKAIRKDVFPAIAYVSNPVGVLNQGSLFLQIPFDTLGHDALSTTGHEADRTALEAITKSLAGTDLSAPVTAEIDSLEASLTLVVSLLDSLSAFIKHNIAVPTNAVTVVGRYLSDTILKVPRIEPDEFSTAFNSHLQDLLMVLYVANLTRVQLAIAERLHKMN